MRIATKIKGILHSAMPHLSRNPINPLVIFLDIPPSHTRAHTRMHRNDYRLTSAAEVLVDACAPNPGLGLGNLLRRNRAHRLSFLFTRCRYVYILRFFANY